MIVISILDYFKMLFLVSLVLWPSESTLSCGGRESFTHSAAVDVTQQEEELLQWNENGG